MAVTMTMTTGGVAEMPDGVRDKFEVPLKKAEAEFGPSGVAVSPLLGSGLLGRGGVGTPTTGLEDHRDLNGEKIKERIEGGEDRCTHARDFKQALYVAHIVPLMLLRVQRREGGD